MIDCNKKEDHKKCRQAHVDECLGKDLNKMCEARKALETRWADDVRPPIGTFSDQIDWAIGEIRRLRAANAELVEALKAGLELMPLGTAKRADWLVKAGNIISLSRAEQAKPETCVWAADIGKLWKTGCGYLLQDSGNPEEGLCPICGKRVEVKE